MRGNVYALIATGILAIALDTQSVTSTPEATPVVTPDQAPVVTPDQAPPVPAVPPATPEQSQDGGEQTKAEPSTIDFYTGPNCVWCERFKARIPELRKKGWRVRVFDAERGKPRPYFDVHMAGKTRHHVGYLSRDRLRAIIRELTGTAMPVCCRPARTVEQKEYVPKWTYPSHRQTLEEHLAGEPHFFDTTSMTQTQRFRLHDDHHKELEAIKAASGCPGGNCPTGTTRRVRRWGLFR